MGIKLFYGLLMLAALASCTQKDKHLPYLQQEIVGKDTTYRTIPAFQFLNQDSVPISQKDFNGAIYVADFFFTSCPTICPVMHRNLLKVYHKYLGNPQVKFASHTIDMKYDTPSKMKAYASKLGVKGTQWEFLWGSRNAVYGMAARNYLVSVAEDSKGPGGFVHQGYLILVDKNKRIRGAYDGTECGQVEQLMKDMDILLAEK